MNAGGLVRIIARRLAFKSRDRWERDRLNGSLDAERDAGFDRAKPVSTLDLLPERLDIEAFLASLDVDALRLVEFKLAGFSDRDIAAELDVAPQTVRNRLVALRRDLRARWEASA